MSQHCDDSVSGKVREFCEENLLNGAMHLHDSPCDFEYQGPIRLDDALEMYAGRQTETLQSEIETLKAQLATANNEIRRLRNVAGGQSIQLRVSEAQVRELRELSTRLLTECRRLQTNTFDKALPDFALSSQIEAALRSAPPSDPGRSRVHLELSEWGRPIIYIADSQNGIATNKCVFSNRADAVNWVKREAFGAINWATWKPRGKYPNCEFDAEGYDPTFLAEWEGGFVRVRRTEVTTLAMENPTLAYQAPFDKTNDGEERKDLAQSSDGRNNEVRKSNHAPMAIGSPENLDPSQEGQSVPSEQVPAARIPNAAQAEGNSGSSSSTGRASVAQTEGSGFESQDERSAGKDSPSRSEWISVEERLPENERLVLAFAPQIDSDLDSEIQVAWYNGDAKHCKWEGEISRLDEKVTHWQPLPTAPPIPPPVKRRKQNDE